MDDTFGTESMVKTIEVSSGQIITSISIVSVLDNVYYFAHYKITSQRKIGLK